MPAKQRVTNQQILDALHETDGIVGLAAARLGVSRQALEKRFKTSPELLQTKEDIDEGLVEFAWARVIRRVMAGDGVTVRWYLQRHGAERGYGRGPDPRPRQAAELTPEELERLKTFLAASNILAGRWG